MNPTSPVVLDLPADNAAPAVVRAALRQLAESSRDVQLLPTELDEVAAAVQEACTNVVRHAYRDESRGPLLVEIHRRPTALEIRVIDHGRAFELNDRPLPDPTELREGGYGTHIIRSWMHEVELRRERGRNVLRMVRHYAPEAVCSGGAVDA